MNFIKELRLSINHVKAYIEKGNLEQLFNERKEKMIDTIKEAPYRDFTFNGENHKIQYMPYVFNGPKDQIDFYNHLISMQEKKICNQTWEQYSRKLSIVQKADNISGLLREPCLEEYVSSKSKNNITGYFMQIGIDDFDEIRDWAAFHHERLDGTGYPFGKSADELNECERIMACVDIYQALTESRPYKKGMTHEKAIGILEDMAQKGWLDKNIVLKTDECFSV